MEQLGLLTAAMLAPVNLGYTILLMVVLAYWGLVIIGALGIDLFHVDMDSHLEVDADLDVAGDADADTGGDAGGDHGGALRALFLFFNLGEVPVMVFVSVLALSMWAVSLAVNLVLDNESLLLGVPIFAGNVLVSAFVAKVVTAPIKRVFRALDRNADGEPGHDVLGRTCVISTSRATETFGQAVIETEGAPLILNVVTFPGETLKKGEEAVVIDYIEEKRAYAVKSRWQEEG